MNDLTTCEVAGCGKPTLIVVARRRHIAKSAHDSCLAQSDPSAPRHPRCAAHANADAYQLDGVPLRCPRCFGGQRA